MLLRFKPGMLVLRPYFCKYWYLAASMIFPWWSIMEHTPEEEERIKAIQRYLEGEREVDIYRSLERSKGWFNKWLGRYKTGRKGWYKDLPKRARVIPHKTSERIEQIVVNIRKALMDGTVDSTKYSCVGAEAIQNFIWKSWVTNHQRFHLSPPSNGLSSGIN